jgi:uncharacterized membrane-anchored protein
MSIRKLIVLLSTLLVLAVVNLAIYDREKLLTQGQVVLLELAPIDPRSLMQGDYMALRFKLINDAFSSKALDEYSVQPKDGIIIVTLDAHGIGTFKRLADGTPDGTPLAAGEIALRYRIRNGQPKFGTNAFFFQEGQAASYVTARYGEFRVGRDGEMILTGLRGRDLAVLGPVRRTTTP